MIRIRDNLPLESYSACKEYKSSRTGASRFIITRKGEAQRGDYKTHLKIGLREESGSRV